MNFRMSKTLFFKINKNILNCIMISEKKNQGLGRMAFYKSHSLNEQLFWAFHFAMLWDGRTCLSKSTAIAVVFVWIKWLHFELL